MALFPQSFLDDLKAQTDIVSIIGDVTPLKKAGATWKGLCPFHTEKSPSFNVNKDKGFFKCFGCGVGGDVVKFVELYQKVTFPEAVRYLAQRASLPIPETVEGSEDRVAAAEREALVKLHEDAQVFYLEQLTGPSGTRARREIEARGWQRPRSRHLATDTPRPAAWTRSTPCFLAGKCPCRCKSCPAWSCSETMGGLPTGFGIG